MTLKELNSLRHIDGEIRMLEDKLIELRTQAEKVTPTVKTYTQINPDTGEKEICVLPNMGGAGSEHSRIENSVEAIDKAQSQLEEILKKRKSEEKKLIEYINGIPDSQVRQIFTYRFVDVLTWAEVAQRIGGGNTSDGVRKKVMRYLEIN